MTPRPHPRVEPKTPLPTSFVMCSRARRIGLGPRKRIPMTEEQAIAAATAVAAHESAAHNEKNGGRSAAVGKLENR